MNIKDVKVGDVVKYYPRDSSSPRPHRATVTRVTRCTVVIRGWDGGWTERVHANKHGALGAISEWGPEDEAAHEKLLRKQKAGAVARKIADHFLVTPFQAAPDELVDTLLKLGEKFTEELR